MIWELRVEEGLTLNFWSQKTLTIDQIQLSELQPSISVKQY